MPSDPRHLQPEIAPQGAELGPVRVAVVDDSGIDRDLIEQHFKALAGFELGFFADPRKGLDWCIENRPGLILLDHLMPALSGVEFLRRLRADPELAQVPVIMITASDGRELLEEVLQFGMTDFLRKPFEHAELLARVRNMLELRKRQRQLEEANRQLFVEATTDALTGLKNRRYFLEILGQEMERARRYRRPCTLAFVDLDRFKRINDTHGHAAGDHVLCEFARLLAGELRGADQVGRVGGEEFAVLFPETGLSQAARACEHLQATVRAHTVAFGSLSLSFTFSAGLTEVDFRDDSVAAVMRRADQALYRAKEGGRDRIETVDKRVPCMPDIIKG